MNKITPEIDLELSIKALEAYNVEPNIIKSMLTNIDRIKMAAEAWLPRSTQCTYTQSGEEILEGHILGYGDNYPCVVFYNKHEAKFEAIEFGYEDEGYLYRSHDLRSYTVPWKILGHINTTKVEGMPENFDYNENIKHYFK